MSNEPATNASYLALAPVLGERDVPEAAVARLPLYLRALNGFAEAGTQTVSSEELAQAVGIKSAKLRKDLSYLGSYGTRGVGYEVGYLIQQISSVLGLSQNWRVVIVGLGNLGRALAGYEGFGSRGFKVVGLVDADPMIVDTEIGWLRVKDISVLEKVIAVGNATMAVLTVPASVAQETADRIVAAGITSILNFAPTVLKVPRHVQVRKVDLATELQILAFHAQRSADAAQGVVQ